MTDLPALKQRNAQRWAQAKLTRGPEFAKAATRLLQGKPRYQAVEARTGVPWYFIAVAHEREASGSWSANLAQGDPWNRVSTHVPAGRGPFKSWEDAAVDALTNCAPYAARNKDWSVGGLLTMLEMYNGLGYALHGAPSPYVWSGTDQYVRGKIVVDHGPIEPIVDRQLGCAGLLLAMAQQDSSIKLEQATPVPTPTPAKPATVTPKAATAGGVVVAGGLATAAHQGGAIEWWTWLLILAAIGGVGYVAYRLWEWRRAKPQVADPDQAETVGLQAVRDALDMPAAPQPRPTRKSAPRKPAAKRRAKVKRPAHRKTRKSA